MCDMISNAADQQAVVSRKTMADTARFIGTVHVVLNGRFAYSEHFLRPTAREAWASARRDARLKRDEAPSMGISFDVYRVTPGHEPRFPFIIAGVRGQYLAGGTLTSDEPWLVQNWDGAQWCCVLEPRTEEVAQFKTQRAAVDFALGLATDDARGYPVRAVRRSAAHRPVAEKRTRVS